MPGARDDSGLSLIEVMVSMTLMSVVTALFTTGIVTVYTSSNTTEALTATTQQVHTAFIRLDRSVRYASGVSVPSAAGDWVEYAVDNLGAAGCYQLHITADGRLQTRSRLGATPTSGWSTLASNLDPATSAFQRTVPGPSGSSYQGMDVALTALAGGGVTARRQTISFSFTALNTSAETFSDTVCSTMSRT